MRDDLQYDLCPGCAEVHPKGMGIMWLITHCCPGNMVNYRPGQFRMRHLQSLFSGRNDMQSFIDLLHFPYFEAMPDYENASYMDRFIYSVCRDTEIADMKRLRAYIELEEEFNTKY